MAEYVSVDELENLGINAQALTSYDDTKKRAAIAAASDEADTYIRTAMAVPLVTAPVAVKIHIARMAVFHLLSVRGMDPEHDKLVVDNYDRAIRFFTAIGKGQVTLPGVLPPVDDPSDDLDQPEVFSDLPRGL